MQHSFCQLGGMPVPIPDVVGKSNRLVEFLVWRNDSSQQSEGIGFYGANAPVPHAGGTLISSGFAMASQEVVW